MTKFKIGDKVRIKRIDFHMNGELKVKDIGKICVVTNIPYNSAYILDNNIYRANFPEDSLELVGEDTRNLKKGTFLWTVEQMKQGKKVRRKSLSKNTNQYVWYIPSVEKGQCALQTLEKPQTLLLLDDYEANDWEIYEENKFGNFLVSDNGDIRYANKEHSFVIDKEEFNDLEKAIKKARE